MLKPIKDVKGEVMYKVEIEDLDMTAVTVAQQVIRDLMFTKANPAGNKRLRTISEIYKLVQKKYSPQASPIGIAEYVKTEYISWIKHFANLREYLDNDELQIKTWGQPRHFKYEDFYEICPDWHNTSLAHSLITIHDDNFNPCMLEESFTSLPKKLWSKKNTDYTDVPF
tara:strand:- start:2047 stop:2553 length:507 start_codon:yes stop_codon:yes gene_type:complete